MKLENIKTENDARQSLVEWIVNINILAEKGEETKKEKAFYKKLKNYCQKNFGVDTTPYDNALKETMPWLY